MSKTEPPKTISSVGNDYSTNWSMWDSKLLLSSELGEFSDKETSFDYNNLEKSDCKKQSTAKLRNILPEKQSNFVPFQNQGLFFSYQTKNDLNSEISDDLSAVPEEFRLNINSNNGSGNDGKLSSIKHNNAPRNLQKDVPQSIHKETMPKGIIWNDNLETNCSKANQTLIDNVPNFKLHNTIKKGPHKIYDNPNSYMNGQYKKNILTTSTKNQSISRVPNRPISKSSTIKDSTKETTNPSITILSQTTTIRVVTPERDVETSKTVQKSWTTNSSEELNANETKSEDVLFQHITRKSERKKMTWLEDLCTVKLNNSDEENRDSVYRSSNVCSNSRLQNKAPRPKKNVNFPARKPHFNRNEDIPKEVPDSRTTFSAHAEEFIRGQYRFESERGRQKVERIKVPNRHAKGADHVVKHIIEVVHVNRPTGRNGRKKRSNQKDNSKFTSAGFETETSSENSDLAAAIVKQTVGKEVQSNEKLNRNDITLFQYSSSDQYYLPIANKSEINCVEERECTCALNLRSNGYGGDSQELLVRCKTRNENFESSPKVINREDLQRQKSDLINYGEEISDSIVGSFTAMNMFLSFYNEWEKTRIKAIQLLENIAGNISNTTEKRRKTRGVFEMFSNGGRAIAAIPDPRTVIVGRIVTALSEFVARLFSSSPTLKQSGMNEFELMLCLQQDIDATADMNIYGIQCDQNFQETCKIIEDFHNGIKGWCFEDLSEGIDAEFLKDISTMNPKHHRVYYRRLYKWLQRLAETPSTNISRAFTRGFKDFPDAVDTTNLLNWRFHAQGIDQTVSLRSWEEIRRLLQNGDLVTVEDSLNKIQNSILVLIKERSVMEKDVMELLNTEGKLSLENFNI